MAEWRRDTPNHQNKVAVEIKGQKFPAIGTFIDGTWIVGGFHDESVTGWLELPETSEQLDSRKRYFEENEQKISQIKLFDIVVYENFDHNGRVKAFPAIVEKIHPYGFLDLKVFACKDGKGKYTLHEKVEFGDEVNTWRLFE